MSAYLPALRRFWWIIALGLVAAVVAGLASIYELPSFTKRNQPVYTATARMLVTGSDAPYFRTATTRADVPKPAGGTRAGSGETSQTFAPDVTTLIRAANTFPLIIESDQVAAMRERMFGPAPQGAIASANAIYQVATPGRFRLSEVPVVQVFGTANTAAQAISFTDQTTKAFMNYLKRQQDAAKIPPRQRIVIEAIKTPYEATPSRTTSPSLGVLVFLAVAMAFCLLAIVLDRFTRNDGGTGGIVATIVPATAPEQEALEAELPSAAAGGTVAIYPGSPGSVPPGGPLDNPPGRSRPRRPRLQNAPKNRR
ncbi:MAG: hypothetical protein U0R50_02730 [Gaiellales bacterium]